jgi:hypothetical protein
MGKLLIQIGIRHAKAGGRLCRASGCQMLPDVFFQIGKRVTHDDPRES